MRCGEELPACLNCTSTGRTCDGYRREQESFGPAGSMSVWRLNRAPTFFTTEESRSLRFFQERTTLQLGEFFPDNFWKELVPQVARSEPSVRHALIALSSFHERFVQQQQGLGGDESSFGLRQYNSAIRELLDSRALQRSPLVGLLCCLLFTSIEVGCSCRSPVAISRFL